MTLLTIEHDTLSSSLTTPEQLQDLIPLTGSQLKFILDFRRQIEAILDGRDPRPFLIVGPCSIHDVEAAKEYALLFKELARSVADKFFMVMRCYFEKPRTTLGWKGMLYDPHLDGSYEMEKGIRLARRLLSDLTDLEIPVGSEILEMTTAHYYADYLSWGCIGARTSASPPHRQFASSLEIPMGFKNSIDGNIDVAIQGMISAGSPHIFVGIGQNGVLTRTETLGNPYCHIILRGSERGTNYSAADVSAAVLKCQKANVRNSIVIDCSHDNSAKVPTNQIPAFNSFIEQVNMGSRHLVGAMIESHLLGGSQSIGKDLRYGVSVTDPCLDWKTTKELILEAYARLTDERFRSFSVR